MAGQISVLGANTLPSKVANERPAVVLLPDHDLIGGLAENPLGYIPTRPGHRSLILARFMQQFLMPITKGWMNQRLILG